MSIAFVASYGDIWNTATTPKTASVTVAIGDCLVVMTAGNTATTPTVSGGGLTYTSQNAQTASAQQVTQWTVLPIAAAQTYTISLANSSGFPWGFIVMRFSGVASIGAKAIRFDGVSGIDTESLTTTTAHSAIAMMIKDATGGSSAATYSTATAGTFTQVATPSQGNYGGYYLDAGTAGAKTVGATTPSGAQNTVGALELVPSVVAVAVKPLIVVSRAALVNAATY